MATTVLEPDLQVQKWLDTYLKEYVRESGLQPYMGSGSGAVIQVKVDLTSGGKFLNIPLITRLKGAGITGQQTLEGTEEELGNFNQRIEIDEVAKAVRIRVADEHYSEIGLLQAARDQLTVWARDRLRTDLLTAMGSINGVPYTSATVAQRNAWNAANVDRVLYGNARANFNATHATALGNVTAAMTLSAGVVSLLKRIAKNADPHIRPMRVNAGQGREYFVLFAGSFAFRDLKNDSTISAANRDARPRDVEKNPIFQDGDLIYDGVIIREIPEIADLGTVGSGSARVAPVYLCGAQAVGLAWGQKPKPVRDSFDYGRVQGVGTLEMRGIEKMRFPTGAAGVSIDHGMVTAFVAAAADA